MTQGIKEQKLSGFSFDRIKNSDPKIQKSALIITLHFPDYKHESIPVIDEILTWSNLNKEIRMIAENVKSYLESF